MKIEILDTTLRDGAQAEGISFSVEDKIKIVTVLDELGVDYIEAGNPGSNPKDLSFFETFFSRGIKLNNSVLTAFGSTRRKGVRAEDDKNIRSILDAGTDAVCIFGKCWLFHVTEVLRAAPDENLEMIRDTVSFIKSKGKKVFFDAEHFFDGYANEPNYALECLRAAAEAGADNLTLCDTNGGAHPLYVQETVKKVCGLYDIPIGFHGHNDCGMAVANSVIAAAAGAAHIQGTLTGMGERCGNASLSAIIPNLQLKNNYLCIPPERLSELTRTVRYISEVANIHVNSGEPYVGGAAFAHKGGMHIDAMVKEPRSYEHIDPSLVGNERRYLTSEISGRSTIINRIQKVNPLITKDSPEAAQIIDGLKNLEHDGYQFEAAESSFDLYIRKQLGKYKPLFELVSLKIIGEQPYTEGRSASALIKVIVDGKTEVTAAEGRGPVNALDIALRKALEIFYPQLASVRLTDYKVRVLDSQTATASKVRVLIESADGTERWTTVGVSHDIIEASRLALVDSIEYKLIKDIEHKFKTFM